MALPPSSSELIGGETSRNKASGSPLLGPWKDHTSLRLGGQISSCDWSYPGSLNGG